MSRLQLALDVDDLASSIAFYSGLFGVEVPDVDTVDDELSRLSPAGFASTEERDTTCCYAKHDKFWVDHTPNGERWEIYTVLEDAETFAGDTRVTNCCGGSC